MAYDFGLHALMLEPLTPLQSRSERQSVDVLQIFTHVTPVPETESQTDSSGHWSVDPDVVQAAVQYPPGTAVLHCRSSSHPLDAVHVPPTFGGSLPQLAPAKSNKTRPIMVMNFM